MIRFFTGLTFTLTSLMIVIYFIAVVFVATSAYKLVTSEGNMHAAGETIGVFIKGIEDGRTGDTPTSEE